MEYKLRPQELFYLDRPLFSNPVEMMKYTLLGLHVEGHLTIFYKNIYINKNAKYKRPRILVKLGDKYNSNIAYTEAETFLLSQINKPEMRLFELRNAIVKELEKNDGNFKYDYVYKDVSFKRLIYTKYFFLTGKGRKALKGQKEIIDDIEDNVDELLLDKHKLNEKLDELGVNVVFLDDDVLEKIGKKIINIDEIYRLFNPEGNSTGTYISYGGYGGGYGGYSGGGGGWGGFGGGSFGGGGSGGSW